MKSDQEHQSPSFYGWHYSKLSGDYRDIGYNHGYQHAGVIAKIIRRMRDYNFWSTGMTWEYFRDYIKTLWWKRIPSTYREEIEGIAEGVNQRGISDINADDIFLWNTYIEVLWYLWPTYKNEMLKLKNARQEPGKSFDSCSAFIAVGSDYTQNGEIVMAHNSFVPFELACMDLVLDIETKAGNRFVMQTAPGLIYSSTDFGVNNNGLMITETTIGGFDNYDCNGMPEFIRARMAMEQSADFDEFIQLMKDGNTGGYANSWLVGDVNKKQVMRLELGRQFTPYTITDNGYFTGFNAPLDPQVRNLECSNTGYMDIRRHQGARQVRLMRLVEKYRHRQDKITIEAAQKILADHVDEYLFQKDKKKIENPCSRTVDAHYELDPRDYMSQIGRPQPFLPQGAVDGKAMDSPMAKTLDFWVKWGSSSNIDFDAEQFFTDHPQFLDLKPYIDSRTAEDWVKVADLRGKLEE
jgi:hypothetical protein